MASAARRRLAKDQGALLESPPPDYFFAPEYSPENLSVVSIYLVGPTSTPFENGLFNISLRIPANYPNEPPKATFHTKIFHPNVDPRSGDVCVDTLKRDWDPKLTLHDVLVTIHCLLVYPNPTSSLNESAGKLLLDDYDAFSRHAQLWTDIHAKVPEEFGQLMFETRNRKAEDEDEDAPVTPARKQEPIKPSSSRTGGNSQPQKKRVASSTTTNHPSTTKVVRKIKRAVSPTARAQSSDQGSDSEGSGKENIENRRPVSPTGSKRSREQVDHSASIVDDEGLGGKQPSGRKSPKLGHRSLPTESAKKLVHKKSSSKVKDKKKAGPKLGLRRF